MEGFFSIHTFYYFETGIIFISCYVREWAHNAQFNTNFYHFTFLKAIAVVAHWKDSLVSIAVSWLVI